MRRQPTPNADLFCLYIAARAWVFDKQCAWLLDLAHDDLSDHGAVEPAVAWEILRRCGVSSTQLVDAAGIVPRHLWYAVAAGGWVLARVEVPALLGYPTWAILDWCADHGQRVLYWTEVGAEPLAAGPDELHWLGEALIIPAGKRFPDHGERGFPSPN